MYHVGWLFKMQNAMAFNRFTKLSSYYHMDLGMFFHHFKKESLCPLAVTVCSPRGPPATPRLHSAFGFASVGLV